jgi:hypothetical protein
MVFRRSRIRAARSGIAALNAPRPRSPLLAAAIAATLIGSGACPATAQPSPPPNGYAILARVKAGLRSGERPAFVAYTLVRRDALDRVPDAANSYTLRVWCRTADGAALSRRVFGSRAVGGADFIVPAFDQPIDPGPPTADLLDVIRQTRAAAPTPAGATRVIGSVSVVIETNYQVTFAGIDGNDDHLWLEARRDPERNRLTDLYVDRDTYALHRVVAHDRLYAAGRVTPLRFEIDFGTNQGVPVITAIRGETDYTALDSRVRDEPLHEVTYQFKDIRFPAELPAWYFQPEQYGAHRSELPA